MTEYLRERCAVCGRTDRRPVANLGHRRIVRCTECDYVWADRYDGEALREAYLRDYYASEDDERIEAWIAKNEGVWNGLCATLERFRPEPGSLLDVGAGTGGFLLEMARRSPRTRLFAVESSDNARTSLESRLPDVRFVARDAADLLEAPAGSGAPEPAADGGYDVVTMLQTLEHVGDPLGVSSAVRESLAPDGMFLVTVPNNRSWGVMLRGTGDEGCYGNPTHLQFFDRRSLEALLVAAGFSRFRRVVGFGGSNVGGLAPRLAQVGLRVMGVSNELRYLAWR